MTNSRRQSPPSVALSLIIVLLATASVHAQSGPPPWSRTETRADCTDYEPLRQPLFGDTHVHTTLSFDAVIGGVITGPREAYDFAQGAPIDLPPYDPNNVATRSAQLRRPLDFTAISDHAELFGEVQICLTPSLPGYNDPVCQDYRSAIPQIGPGVGAFAAFVVTYLAVPDPIRHSFCGPGDANCVNEASLVWQDTQDAAEENYDRTAACTFTSLIGYEWSRAPGAQNLHRNVIFRNDVVPALPISGVEEPTPQGLWAELDTQCLQGLPGCDVLAIPHNSNLSNGAQFIPENADGSPLTKQDALFRSAIEPIVEITQHKGDSECRPGILSSDELCSFEKVTPILLGLFLPSPTYDPRLFVRNVLKEGLEVDEILGANPFMMGIIGSTDTHGSTPGLVHEEDYGESGHVGTRDSAPEFILAPPNVEPLGGVESQGGGLAVVWAEENSRDAIFAAMRRREVYGTSGTRPTLRMFAGDFGGDLCKKGTLVDQGYRRGVPMGAEVGAIRKSRSPRFAVMATKDPGPVGGPSTPLQRLQIIKGWLDDQGNSQEQVFEIAGNPNNGATVDESTCIPSGAGFDTLCSVWEDPDFDPSQRAFYYARAVENPTCRWSQHLCNAQDVDCAVPATILPGLEECCNPDVPGTIQERAWSSPIWYRPESLGKSKGRIKLRGNGEDSFQFKTMIENTPGEVNPNVHDITITVTDDDTIYTATIPAGTMFETQAGTAWRFKDKTGAIDGIQRVKLRISKGQAKFSIRTVKMDLSNADPGEHFIQTTISAATFSASHSRLWESKKGSLKSRS